MVFVPHSERRRTQDVLSRSSASFASLHLSDTYRRALLLAGYRSPSPVQETAIPLVRLGTDLVVKAKSGTGKTLVFALACVDRVDASQPFPQALVLSPTREIAQQNATEIKKIANNLPFPNLSCGVFTGGVAVGEDRRRLRRPCQVVVATPGRLAWLVQKNEIQLDHVRLVVMDEADQLYTDSLRPSVQFLLGALPTARQSLAFSATYPSEILPEIEREMDYPQRVFIEEQHHTTSNNNNKSSLIGVKQCYKLVEECPDDTVEDDALFERKVHALFEIFSSISFHQAVVFCNSRERAEALSERLHASGFPSAFTSGQKSQEHRNRTMAAMRQFELRVIVSTDLIARGVDLERVNLVCNLDLPYDRETYQHRIGRTGRFGTYGISVTVVTPSELETLKQKYTSTTTSTAAEEEDSDMTQQELSSLIELPHRIPHEWYKDQLSSKEEHVAYQKLLEAPVAADAVKQIPSHHAQWLGSVSKSEFASWKERIEKRHPFWNHWDPYSCAMSRSSSREGVLRLASAVAPSEVSCETGSTSQRRTNCIRLPSRLSHTTSASSVVYSEEGECEYLDMDDDPSSWSETESQGQSDEERAEVHDAEIQALAQTATNKPQLLQPPSMPPTIDSLADFEAVRDRYEQWRKEYSEWREQYAIWYDTVQAAAPPPPPPVI